MLVVLSYYLITPGSCCRIKNKLFKSNLISFIGTKSCTKFRMRYTNAIHYFVLISLIIGCNSGKDDPGIDCTESDLSLVVETFESVKCDLPGQLVLTASGGTGDYQFSMSGSEYQEENVFDGLTAGSYIFLVKDGNDCTVSVNAVIPSESGNVLAQITSKTTSGCTTSNGEVKISAVGGTETYQYSIDDREFTSSNTFTGLEAGTHTYIVKDAEGCNDDGTFEILSGTSLESEVMPIIEVNCAVTGCHGSSQSPLLNTKEQIMANAERINSRTSSGSMPPPEREDLTQREIDLITCWVEDGAANN